MDRPKCPKCGGEKFVGGHCVSLDGSAYEFAPSQMRPLRLKQGVRLTIGFAACLSCGHVWGSVAPDDLRSFILDYGNELARQNLDVLDHGAMQGLPDTELAHKVASTLAALDRLVLIGKPTEVSEKFRELMGVTWEQALKATRKWQHLTRDEKLERLGWVAKKSIKVDDMAEPLL